jgi:hypothetical protein
MFDLPLKIKATEKTPLLEYNPIERTFSVIGVSVPEDAKMFYDPILLWVSGYVKSNTNGGMTININLDYFSTKSSLILLKMLKKFEVLPNILINWYYDDSESKEIGDDFSTMVNLTFNLIDKNPDIYKEYL